MCVFFAPCDQVAFPKTRNRTVFDVRRAVSDRHPIDDLSAWLASVLAFFERGTFAGITDARLASS